jgi:type VI secretion system protein ImpM
MTAESAHAPGLFGKVPMLGDFVSRRLPGSFIDAWDDWLRRGIACSRDVLADDWLPLYLAGPVWRFVLQPDVLSEDSVAGVLMPSVDAVNRHFPLTVAAVAPSAPGPFALAAEAEPWFAAAETLALSCLGPDATLPSVERSLDALGPVPACGTAGMGPEMVAPPGGARLRWRLACGLPGGVRILCPHLVDAVASAAYGPFSLWWTSGSDDVDPVLLVFSGLPSPEAFSALLRDAPTPPESVAADRSFACQTGSRACP